MIESRSSEVAATLRDIKILDYSNIPQCKQDYPASDRAKKIVQKSKTMDTLFSAVYPTQWSRAAAPELHDELARCKAAGFKVLTVCPSSDSLETDIMPLAKALIAYFKKFSEHPARRRQDTVSPTEYGQGWRTHPAECPAPISCRRLAYLFHDVLGEYDPNGTLVRTYFRTTLFVSMRGNGIGYFKEAASQTLADRMFSSSRYFLKGTQP